MCVCEHQCAPPLKSCSTIPTLKNTRFERSRGLHIIQMNTPCRLKLRCGARTEDVLEEEEAHLLYEPLNNGSLTELNRSHCDHAKTKTKHKSRIIFQCKNNN